MNSNTPVHLPLYLIESTMLIAVVYYLPYMQYRRTDMEDLLYEGLSTRRILQIYCFSFGQ